MSVLVDTCIWSEAFRKPSRTRPREVIAELTRLIRSDRAVLIGVVRQELLSGLRHNRQYVALRDTLQVFPDHPVTTADYELAAAYYTICRRKGVSGSNTDLLLCAVADRNRFSLFTVDGDFKRYARHLGTQLYWPVS